MINISQKQLIIIIIIGVIIIGSIGYYIYNSKSENSYEQLETISEEQDTKNEENVENDEEEIVIHIAGQIKKPGIIRIKEGARIADIIEKAEGLTEKANIENINLAYIVEDGQKITIPSKEETEEKESITTQAGEGIITDTSQTSNIKTDTPKQKTTGKININKAEQEELQNLSGIGESTAIKIIEYRKQNGEFKEIEEIKNVPGIGDAKYEQIKENIKVK